jgi:hypothetical protein
VAIVGLDTSVVVRLLTGFPPKQFRAAKARLERALDEGDYGVPKSEARGLLFRLVTSGVVALDPPGSVNVLSETGGAGMVDRLIHARHRTLGGITLTFERSQSRLEGAERLKTG